MGFLNRLFGFILGGGKYFLIFALIITALSNVTLVKDNLEKYVKDSVLYPYLKESGAYLINLDPATLGITTTDISQEQNTSTETNSSNITDETNITVQPTAEQ